MPLSFPRLNRYESYRYKLPVQSDVMAIYQTILREDSLSKRVSMWNTPLPVLSLCHVPRPPALLSLSHHRNSLLFLLPLRNSQDAREGVNDPDGDFQGSADWNHRRDSSRLNSNCWGDRKKVKRWGVGESQYLSRGNPNVCYALSICIPDSRTYVFWSVLLYTGNASVTKTPSLSKLKRSSVQSE